MLLSTIALSKKLGKYVHRLCAMVNDSIILNCSNLIDDLISTKNVGGYLYNTRTRLYTRTLKIQMPKIMLTYQ